jgi:AcrR family transcriptional regulator
MDPTVEESTVAKDRSTAAKSAKPATSPVQAKGAGTGRRRASAQAGRAEKTAARREAILNAALDEFSASGFAAARIDDIARRAGVAKGTIYLHFADKEELFQEIVRTMVLPIVATLEAMPPPDVPIRIALDRMVDMFVREIYGTRRRDVVKLVMAEVPRFPALAEFYYNTVISRAIGAMGSLLRRARARGDTIDDALLQFPQLIIAPGIFSIIWNGLFERYAPVDVAALMRAHLDLLFGKGGAA